MWPVNCPRNTESNKGGFANGNNEPADIHKQAATEEVALCFGWIDSTLKKYRAAVEEAQRIHSVAWYISMITDDYISLDEELQELEKQREFEADLYSFSS